MSLGPAIRAFDLLEANAERSRKAVVAVLVTYGLSDDEAASLAEEWITTGDFLLHRHDLGAADYVVGNPPYIRLENVASETMEAYRETCSTMRGRADVYVGFIERGIDLLKPGGILSFICADRWMRNQYGGRLRDRISTSVAVETIVSMHEVDAFEDDVSAYPAIVVLRNKEQGKVAVVNANRKLDQADTPQLTAWALRGRRHAVEGKSYQANRVDHWFSGNGVWPTGTPSELALLADLESRFPPLEDPQTGTRVGIGVATGCDDVFITSDANLVESERLLPLIRRRDIANGTVAWMGDYLVNPWDGPNLVDLADYPRLKAYMASNSGQLKARHIVAQRSAPWHRTIDRIHQDLTGRSKLVMPDIRTSAHPVLDDGGFYPHHNLYFIVSDKWDLEVLGGLLLSDVANLFVGAYSVRMRGDAYRFQAQSLRRIRLPHPSSVRDKEAQELALAFRDRNSEWATSVAARLFGVQVPLGASL